MKNENMKKLTTETSTTGKAMASVHDYQSGAKIGEAVADWDQYRAWANGPSDVCEAHRCISADDIARLGIATDTVIFLLD